MKCNKTLMTFIATAIVGVLLFGGCSVSDVATSGDKSGAATTGTAVTDTATAGAATSGADNTEDVSIDRQAAASGTNSADDVSIYGEVDPSSAREMMTIDEAIRTLRSKSA